jgi:hypothetical protein
MAVEWYYEMDGSRQGPYSGEELQALAAAGTIRPTDTVWREGVAQGVPAHRVRNLFAPGGAAAAPVPAPAAESPSPLKPSQEARAESDAAHAEAAPASPGNTGTPAAAAAPQPTSGPRKGEASEEVTKPAPRPPMAPAPAKKGRATAVRGAVIVGQDGVTVYFRKKCTQCGNEETGRNRLPIRNGVTRANYFCPKCRKVRPVEIQGMT